MLIGLLAKEWTEEVNTTRCPPLAGTDHRAHAAPFVTMPTLPKRWAICGVTGTVRGAPLPYWAFLRREPAWVQVVRWTPASGSWSTVKALADSIAAAQAPVVNP